MPSSPLEPQRATRPYPRVELCDDYFLEAYLGWDVAARGASWKIWRRAARGLTRGLVVSEGATPAELAAALDAAPPPWLGATIWNDFSAEADAPDVVRLGRRRFVRSRGAGRWFGAGTYVLDLSADDDTLLARALQSVRSNVRSTRRAGFATQLAERPSPSAVAIFAVRHNTMARERALAPISVETLSRMFADRRAVLATAVDPEGVARAWNVIYLTSTHGYYLHGVHDASVREVAGRQLHMDTAAFLRESGRRWYDLGLVGSAERQEGIHFFKRSLGGVFLPSGVERVATPGALEPAVRGLQRLRDLVRRSRSLRDAPQASRRP
jgi:hypothetical protein